MKQIINQLINRRTLLSALVAVSSLSIQSCKDDEQEKWVDLRYKAEDSYTIAADGSEPINIQVKSTEPWTVYSEHGDWCSISPATGDAGEIYDVVIRYQPNTGLDERTDKIIIQSDYWMGKEVVVIQKGIAYLRIEGYENAEEPIELGKAETLLPLTVKANQKWSATVTKGGEWLSIPGDKTGNLDGTVQLKATENKGEQRTGEVVFYDRHDQAAITLTCIQEGIVLNPEASTLKVAYGTTTVELPVTSNGEWMVEKENADDVWYSFDQTDYSGDGIISIRILQQNDGAAVRTSKFKVRNKAGVGDEPIEKVVTLKLGYQVEAQRNTFAAGDWQVTAGEPVFANGEVTFTPAGGNCRISREGMKPGYYTFHIKDSDPDAKCQLYFLYGTIEVRWMLFKGGGDNARCGTSDAGVEQIKFDDTKKGYTIGMNLLPGTASGSMNLEWTLDGQLLKNMPNYTGVSYGTNAQVILGVTPAGGTATYDWWEYTAPVDWGED